MTAPIPYTTPFALIIEDDIDLATIFAQALRAAGFETEIVLDGAKARAKLSAKEPDVVVLDLHLPHVSGQKLLEEIRNNERLSDTQVIIATADPRLAEQLQNQADLALVKPISFRQLRDLAQRLQAARPKTE